MRYPILALAAAAILAGCSGDVGLSTDSGESTGTLGGEDGAVGLATSDYVVLDLATGTLTALRDAPDLGATSWRQSRMLFRRVDKQFLIAVFEATQAQWEALGGDDPWSDVPPAIVGASAIDPERPAFALSYDEIDSTLAAYRSATGVRLDFPTGGEWRRASDAGSSDFHWGNAQDREVVNDYALTQDTADGALGPQVVGSGSANGLGIFDLHGNLWEWTDDGTRLRGGSWHDATHAGRASYAIDAAAAGMDDATNHALIGVRLILRP